MSNDGSVNDSANSLDNLRSDLKYQLGMPHELDWDYFLETAIRAKIAADKEGRNNPEHDPRSMPEILNDAKVMSVKSA